MLCCRWTGVLDSPGGGSIVGCDCFFCASGALVTGVSTGVGAGDSILGAGVSDTLTGCAGVGCCGDGLIVAGCEGAIEGEVDVLA